MRSRPSWSSGTGTVPISQHTTVTPESASISVPIRSGSPRYGSAPAVWIASVFACERVVPRTAWPAATSSAASARPRQPQGTIRTRATLGGGRVGLVATGLLGELLAVAAHALLDLLLVAFREPAAAADLVLGVDHLLDVVDVVLRLELGGARRLPVEDVEGGALGEQPEQQHEDDEEEQRAPEDDGERVDDVILAPVSGGPRVIGVLGAGTMGAGIAQVAAQSGARCLLHDPDPEALGRGLESARGRIERAIGKGRLRREELGSLDGVDAVAGLAEAE